MKKNIIIVLIVIVALSCAILIFNSNIEVEYVPESEIAEQDMRNTIIALYFENKSNGEIQKETRLIDSKELLLEPYEELVKMLIDGPKSEEFSKLIPDNTKINNIELVGSQVNIDFSSEFLNNQGKTDIIINSIMMTLTELNEVKGVNITVDGENIA